MSLFPSLLNDQLEVGQGSKWVGWILMIVVQNSAEDQMFGHSAWDMFDVVTPNYRFLHNDSYCDVVTRYGPFSKVVTNMGIAVQLPRLGHRYINERPVDSG